MRIGIGYDAHKLVTERRLVLGGVDIPYQFGLLGHSDADVLCHAIADALLGAAALGDIGSYFSDNDERYRGISSLILLSEVAVVLSRNGYSISNIDSVIIAEEPKLASYIGRMRVNIGKALDIHSEQVGIKATTTEGMGFCGIGEGIAAEAIALIQPRGQLPEDSGKMLFAESKRKK
jgi:2-C-methyl-D-erythritol 2,4-cyclodiphosphate synthase